jgi:hypothetical protein
MEKQGNICQSCAMPLSFDPNKEGSNTNGSLSDLYCSFCFKEGEFLDEGIDLKGKIEKNIQIAVEKMGMPEEKARAMAESVLPDLLRWK